VRRRLPLIVSIVLLASCGGEPAAEEPAVEVTVEPGTREGTVETAVGDRTYRLHVPPGVAEAVPLVVALHGGGGSGQQFAGENGLEAIADDEGFVVVHPDGIAGPAGARTWNAGNCCGAAAAQGVDDIAFLRVLVAQLQQELPIDLDRIYAVGHSNGGMLAYRLACEAADLFAAVGLQAGALGIDGCEPSQPVSLLHIHGTDDPNVPMAGGRGSGPSGTDYRSVRASLEAVATAGGCDDEPTEATDAGETTRRTLTWSCPGGVEVQLATVEGGRHGWFGGSRAERRDGPSTADSSRLIWAFLDAHPR
jgi:polyhydroxybutyrate depolymerase